MTLLMRDQLNIEKGIEKGEDKFSQLIARLMEDKRSQDVIRVTQDKRYRNKLYEEYLIDQSYHRLTGSCVSLSIDGRIIYHLYPKNTNYGAVAESCFQDSPFFDAQRWERNYATYAARTAHGR